MEFSSPPRHNYICYEVLILSIVTHVTKPSKSMQEYFTGLLRRVQIKINILNVLRHGIESIYTRNPRAARYGPLVLI
jgi:hypothetical protein